MLSTPYCRTRTSTSPHSRSFTTTLTPDTHLTAERIVSEGTPLWLVFRDGTVRGYFTYKLAAGESVARIEHMSTDPSLPEDVRNEVRVDLLRAALRALFDIPNISQVEMV